MSVIHDKSAILTTAPLQAKSTENRSLKVSVIRFDGQ